MAENFLKAPTDFDAVRSWAEQKGFRLGYDFVRHEMGIRERSMEGYNPALCEDVFLGRLVKCMLGYPARKPVDYIVRLPFNPNDGSDRPGGKYFELDKTNVLVVYDGVLADRYKADPSKVPVQAFPVNFYHFDGGLLVDDGGYGRIDIVAPKNSWGIRQIKPDIYNDAFEHGAAIGAVTSWVWDDWIEDYVCDASVKQGLGCPCGKVIFDGLSHFNATKDGVAWWLPAINLELPADLLSKDSFRVTVVMRKKSGAFETVNVKKAVEDAINMIGPLITALGYQVDSEVEWEMGGVTYKGPAVVVNGDKLAVVLPVVRAGSLAINLVTAAVLIAISAAVIAVAAAWWHHDNVVEGLYLEWYDLCKAHPELCEETKPEVPGPGDVTKNITDLVKWGVIAIVAINVLPALGEALRGGERD